MNLVIDDAVEVKLASKTEEEKRRSLGNAPSLIQRHKVLMVNRPDFAQRRQRFSHSSSIIRPFRNRHLGTQVQRHCRRVPVRYKNVSGT